MVAVLSLQQPEVQIGIIFFAEVLPALIWTAGGVAAFWIGARAFVRLKRSHTPTELADVPHSLELLQESMDDIRDVLHAQMDEVRELSGRIEFAERLLTKARDEDRN
jgi:hypothetical protein